MRIQSTRRPLSQKQISKPPEMPEKNSEGKPVTTQSNWRGITLNEAAVEIPQGFLELSDLQETSPIAGNILQVGISGLALTRAVQCFKDAEGIEEVLEGVSSGALAVAGASSLFPAAGLISQSFLVGHGAAELALGVREVTEELKKDSPAKLELVGGVLDMAKGASTFLPLVFPTTADAVNVFQIGAIIAKTALEPYMERSNPSA